MATPKQLPTKQDKADLALPDWPESCSALQKRFLNAYAVGGSISRACRSVKMARANPYRWAEANPEFRVALDEAREAGVQRLEDWALTRAMDDMNPSDRLTEFLLKALRPAVYRERVDHHMHGTVEHKKKVVLEDLDQDRVIKIDPDAARNANVDASVTPYALLEKRREEESKKEIPEVEITGLTEDPQPM